jgi:hypothetical protein
MKMMHRITDNVIYDPSIGKAFRDGILPGHFLTEENSDWAIIPTYRGKSYHDMFYGGVKQHPLESGLPQAVAEIFLGQDILSDSGYALVYKRVICLKSQDGEFYKANLPNFVKTDEIWGDYLYAGYFVSILHALSKGCERLAIFPTGGSFLKWHWSAVVRASHNAVSEYGGVSPLHICEVCVGGLPTFAWNKEEFVFSPHTPLENSGSSDFNSDIKILKFTPSKISKYAQLETPSPRSSPNK